MKSISANSAIILFLSALFAVAVPSLLILKLQSLPHTAEVQIGAVIALSLAGLVALIFIVVIGFTLLGLSDRRQALGLPDGSVRAIIALFLILVFVLLSIYVFRTLVDDQRGPPLTLTSVSADEVSRLDGTITAITPAGSGLFDVTFEQRISAEGHQLGQQLVTVLGTLAVAVSAFYFGTGSVKAALKAVVPPTAAIELYGLTPSSAAAGSSVELIISGRNLLTVDHVALTRKAETMLATNVLSSDAEIRCTLKVDKSAGDDWDVVVETNAGTTARLSKSFSVT